MEGSPTVVSSGISSSNPTTTACTPNEVKVVQLRRVRWAHEVSSKLSAKIFSANIFCSGMVSSSDRICLLLWTPQSPRFGGVAENKKGRVCTRPVGTFWTLQVSACYCFGVSAGLGAGFGVVAAPDFGAAGL